MGSFARIMERVNSIESRKSEANRLKEEEMIRAGKEISLMQDIESMKIYNRYLDRLDAEYRRAEEEFVSIRDDFEREKGKLIEAKKNRRIVELLKDKKREEYRKESEKSDRKKYEELNQLLKRKGISPPPLETMPPQREIAEERLDELVEERPRKPGEDLVSEYFEKQGIEYPRKRKR